MTETRASEATRLGAPTFSLNEPGSYLYDGMQAVKGRRINRFGNSFKIAANREAFRADPESYLAQADLTDEERAGIRGRDWPWLVSHGGHIQALQRIAVMEGQYLFHIAACIMGVPVEDLIAACPRRVVGLGGIGG